MTIDSPWTLGSVTTRRSTWWPSIVRLTRPSCGTRRSAMSRSAMIFTRLMTPETMRLGIVVVSSSTPSMRKRTRRSLAVGLEVDVGRALLDGLGDDLVDELDDRLVVGGVAQVDDLGRAVVELSSPPNETSSTTSSRRVMRLMSAADVLAAGDGGADLEARHDRDVVDRPGRWPGRPWRRAACARRRRRPARPRSAWRRRCRAGWRPPCRPGRLSGRGGRGRGARRWRGRAGPG